MRDKSVIVANKVSKKFGEIEALREVSFVINEGEIFGYVGPNGAGKTTTVRIMLGLLRPDRGYVSVFGSRIDNGVDFKKNIGAVLEDPGVYDEFSARENLEYYAQLFGVRVSDRGDRINEVLRTVGLWDRMNDRVGTYSKGMKQRLAIARTLLHEPKILIFDEPTAGLDPASQREIRNLLRDLAREKKRTIFICSHNLDEVQRICSHVGILNHGRLLECCSVGELRKKFSKPTLVVTTATSGEVKQVIGKIKKLNFVGDCQADRNRLTVILRDDKYSKKITEFLIKHGISVQEAKFQLPTLEDVYLSIMGEKNE